MYSNISILGGGAWGEALASAFSSKCKKIIIYKRNIYDEIIKYNIEYTNDLAKALTNNIIFLAVPAQSIRDILTQIKPLIIDHYLVICAKGVEISTSKFMSEIAAEFIAKDRISILSGPNFADEIKKGLPAASVIASTKFGFASKLAANLSHDKFYLYPSDDIVSTEIGGALKNVIAIACGIAIGMNMGENCKAGIISAGLMEMSELSKILGGNLVNLMGLAGIGDLTLTCNSQKSRNYKFGFESVKDKTLTNNTTIEGFYSSKSIKSLADKYKLNLPICNFIYEYLYENRPAFDISNLLNKIDFTN